MSSLARPRLVILAIGASCVVAALIAQPLWRGKFAADVEMARLGGDPMRLGVRGGIGPEQPENTAPQIVVGNASAPFDGPTPEEAAAIANLRAAVHDQWTQIHRAMPARMAAAAPEPVISQPFRHLTSWEIAEINRNAAQIRSDAAALP